MWARQDEAISKVATSLTKVLSELSEQEQALIRSRLDVHGSSVAVVDGRRLYDLRRQLTFAVAEWDANGGHQRPVSSSASVAAQSRPSVIYSFIYSS